VHRKPRRSFKCSCWRETWDVLQARLTSLPRENITLHSFYISKAVQRTFWKISPPVTHQHGYRIRPNACSPRPKTREERRSKSTESFWNYIPLTSLQLIALCEEGAEHHKPLSACKKWLCSREINSQKGEESLILVQEYAHSLVQNLHGPPSWFFPDRWASLEALIDHSKWEYSVNMRERIVELTTSFEFKMSKVFVGFSKWGSCVVQVGALIYLLICLLDKEIKERSSNKGLVIKRVVINIIEMISTG